MFLQNSNLNCKLQLKLYYLKLWFEFVFKGKHLIKCYFCCFYSKPWASQWGWYIKPYYGKIDFSAIYETLIYWCGLGCSRPFPALANGWVSCGDDQLHFHNGHVLHYTCERNFASSNNPLICICDTTTDPNNPVWNCGATNFATTCRKSKLYGWYNIKFIHTAINFKFYLTKTFKLDVHLAILLFFLKLWKR